MNLQSAFKAATAISLALGLAACSASSEPIATPTPSSAIADHSNGQQIADSLLVIAKASQELMNREGITESLYVNSNIDPKPFKGLGSLAWNTVYDPSTQTTLSRYPTNPSFREAGTGPQAVSIALDQAFSYVSNDFLPTEKDGVYTFTANPGIQQVTVITTKNGLVVSVLVEDKLEDPESTNTYVVDGYNVTNEKAIQILKTTD
jgi:hypothetical protein